MRQTSLSKLLDILGCHPGAAIVTMVVRTEPELLARSRGDGTPTADRFPRGIEKLALGRFILANRYQDNVRAQRRREGHSCPEAFRVSKLWGGAGQRIGPCLARHAGHDRLYLVARPQTDEQGRPTKIWERWIDLATGLNLDPGQIVDLQANYLRHRPAENRKQQVRRTVPFRTYHVISVHSVAFGGEVYQIEPDRSAYVA